MKKTFLAILLTCFVLPVFAYNGIAYGEQNLKVAKTKWFDIIYPEASTEIASLLYEKVDDIYDDVTKDYGIDPYFRMPLVITPGTEQFNAYFTSYPYNHIVMYDAGSIPQLEVFTESICSTFRHELTHAITFNHKNDFWKFIGKVLGDPINPSYVMVQAGFAEGATLCSESKYGEGRLNNPLSMLPVVQAKVEGNLPVYFEETSVSGSVNGGYFYEFNGAFHHWLQEKYGMEKYSSFWYKTVNMEGLLIEGVFYRVYGISIHDAWKQCFDEYIAPKIAANPVTDGVSKDFFESNATNYSINNRSGAKYSNICSTDKGVYFIEGCASAIYRTTVNPVDNKRKTEEIFTKNGLFDMGCSSDGRLIAVNYTAKNGPNIKKRALVYDTVNGSTTELNEDGMQAGTIIMDGDKYYYVGQKFDSQKYQVIVKSIVMENNRIKAVEDKDSISFDIENLPTSITYAGKNDGTIAYLKKSGLNYSICIASVNDLKNATSYKVPSDLFIRSLSSNGKKISFTYAKKNTMARLGQLNLSTNEFELDNRDISGSVFYPAGISENETAYVGNFTDCSKLLVIENQKGTIVKVSPEKVSYGNNNPIETNAKLQENIALLKENSRGYMGIFDYPRGVIIPMTSLSSLSYDNDHISGNYSLPFGLTYTTANPWAGNSINISAGYGIQTNSGAVSIGYSKEGFFNSGITLEAEFDQLGFKQTNDSVTFSKKIKVANHSGININSTSTVHYGRSNLSIFDADINAKNSSPFGCAFDAASNNYFFFKQSVSLAFTNAIVVDPGMNSILGYTLNAIGMYELNSLGDFSIIDRNGFESALIATVYIPKLIPIVNVKNFTYNFPTEISLSTLGCNDSSEMGFSYKTDKYLGFEDFNALNLHVKTCLFAYDIQKPLFNCTGLFATNFIMNLNYKVGFDKNAAYEYGQSYIFIYNTMKDIINGTDELGNKLYVDTSMHFTPNIGTFTGRLDLFMYGKGGVLFTPSDYKLFAELGVGMSM